MAGEGVTMTTQPMGKVIPKVEFCSCDEPDPRAVDGLEFGCEDECLTCSKPIETGPQELVRLTTDGSPEALFLAMATNAVAGLVLAKDMDRLGALADMIEGVGRQLGEEIAEANGV